MANISVFDVIGPHMVGPSSSHTAGACAIALLANKMLKGEVKKVKFTLYGSFARTYKGHGTDKALLGGILGFKTDDLRIRDAFKIAKEQRLEFEFIENHTGIENHPNTVDIDMENFRGYKLSLRGESIGGGKMRIASINNITVDFSGEYCSLIVKQNDKPGVAAHITKCLSDFDVNIAFMRLFRENKGKLAYTIVESDSDIDFDIECKLKEYKDIIDVTIIHK